MPVTCCSGCFSLGAATIQDPCITHSSDQGTPSATNFVATSLSSALKSGSWVVTVEVWDDRDFWGCDTDDSLRASCRTCVWTLLADNWVWRRVCSMGFSGIRLFGNKQFLYLRFGCPRSQNLYPSPALSDEWVQISWMVLAVRYVMKDMDNGQQREIEYRGMMPSVTGISLIDVVGRGYGSCAGKVHWAVDKGGYTGNLQRTYIPREISTMLESVHQYYLLNKQPSLAAVYCHYS